MVGGDVTPGPPDPHGSDARDPPVLQGHADEALAVLQNERGDTRTAGERLSRAADDDGHRVAGAILGQQVPDGASRHRAQPCGENGPPVLRDCLPTQRPGGPHEGL